MKKGKGILKIQEYPTKSASVIKLKAYINKLKATGMKPDLIIIDYADLLKPGGANFTEKRLQLEEIYEDLRGWSGEMQIPIWTASQSNRCHLLTDIVETESGKIEIGKVKIGDKILTHKGFKEVKNVFSTEKQPVYKVRLKSGKEINISAEHDVPVMYGKLKSISTGLKIGDKLFTKK